MRRRERFWKQIEERFEELRWVVENSFIESQEMAVGRKVDGEWKSSTPTIYDDYIDADVKSWNTIPYIDGVEEADILEHIKAARRLIPALSRAIAKRQATLSFAETWGRFCSYAAPVQLLFLSQGSDLRSARLSKGKRVDAQRKWVALQLIPMLERRVTRQTAEAVVFERVRRILAAGQTPPGYPIGWYKKILDYDKHGIAQNLAGAFRGEDNFPEHAVLAFRGADPSDIPPLPDL